MGEAKRKRERGDAATSVHQLGITLRRSSPPIRRRIRVDGDITLAELHHVIQAAMGWTDSHLHRFEAGGRSYGPMRWEVAEHDESTARLRRVAPDAGARLLYEYNFGDSWEHEIVVEDRLARGPGERYPTCIAAERACPPEDVGGIGGYEDFLEAVEDPSHPEHDHYLAWAGGAFDPEAADLDEINRRLDRVREGGGAPDAGGDDVGSPPPPDLASFAVRAMAREAIEEVAREKGEPTLADLNAAMGRRMDAYNRRPQRELLGLSPVQVQRLIPTEWNGDDDDALRLDAGLALDDLSASRLLRNARACLAAIEEDGPFRATQAGNLNRAAVSALLERLDWPEGYVDGLRRANKAINEQDAWELHLVRVLLDLGGLIRKYKGAIRTTRRGRELAAPERAGELFASLFRTHFRELNLAYLDRWLPEAHGFQHTAAITLYRFGRVGGEWRKPEALAPQLVLPSVRDEVDGPRGGPGRDWTPAILRNRLLRPLVRFGLAETREVPGRFENIPDHEYRKSPLFDRFLQFDV